MSAPTIDLTLTGTDPKNATIEDLEAAANAALAGNYERLDERAGIHATAGRELLAAPVAYQSERYASYGSASGARVQWAVAGKMGDDGRIDRIHFYADDEGSAVADVQVLVLRKSSDDAGQIVDVSGYDVLADATYAAADLFSPGGGFQNFFVDLPGGVVLRRGERFVVVLRMKDSGGNLLGFGMGRAIHYPNSEEAHAKGGFATGTDLTNFQAISLDAKVFAWFEGAGRGLSQGDEYAVAGRKEGSQWGVDFTQVSFNHRMDGAHIVTALQVPMTEFSSDVALLRMRVVIRPSDIGGYSGGSYVIGEDADDREKFVIEYDAADVFDNDFNSVVQHVRLDFPHGIEVADGDLLMCEVTALQSNRTTYGTFRCAQAAGFTPVADDIEKGSYTLAAPPNGLQNVGTAFSFALVAKDVQRPPTLKVSGVRFNSVVPYAVDGLSLSVPELSFISMERAAVVPAQTLSFNDPTTGTLSSTTLDLRYNQWDPLPARWWSSVTVTRTSDSVVLTEGVDYEIDSPNGRIQGLVNTAEFQVEIDIVANHARIDLVTVTSWDQELQIWEGTEQLADPDSWQPEVDALSSNGRVEVLRVLVKSDGLEVLDRTRTRRASVLPKEPGDEIEALIAHNHRHLAKVRMALLRGQDIEYVFYGDSITAGHGGYSPEADQLLPNGVSRDRWASYTGQIADGSWAQMGAPKIDGPAGAGLHTQASYHHRLANFLEQDFGITVTRQNLGIGGTTSASGGSGTEGDRYNGSNATRLGAITTLANTLSAGGGGVMLVTLGFGTNDADDEVLINNMVYIARHCSNINAVGVDVVPLIIGQPNVAGPRGLQRLQRNDRRLFDAAMTAPCAFVPLSLLYGDGRAHGCFFDSLISGAGGTNHPGLWEHYQYARLIDEFCFS